MISISENQFRDHLFNHHKETLSGLIVGRREPVEWTEDGFPTIQFLLQRRTEQKINEILDNLKGLVLTAKELKLERNVPHPTRVDLFGISASTGITIIELKKSEQTERQAFTELLAYSNHFCSIFPGLKESAITSILVAPMETRTAKDAYVQELVSNAKNLLALIPHQNGNDFTLKVFYPAPSYYAYFENNILNDASMICVALEFPLIEGWIDSDLNSENRSPPDYTKDALNTIANSIAQRLASEGFHALIYANQKWGEIATLFPNPNVIVVAAMNPFSSYRTAIHDGRIYGNSDEGRISQVQAIYDQLTEDGKDYYWVDTMESHFHDNLMRVVSEQFEHCFQNKKQEPIHFELSCPDWYGLKTSFVDSVSTHNLNIYSTGLLREIYLEYMNHVFKTGIDEIFYYDDLPIYGYKMLTPFLAVWQIFSGLGYEEDNSVCEMGDEDET